MPMSEIKERINKVRTDFYQDPLNYRLHGGESLGDLIRVRLRHAVHHGSVLYQCVDIVRAAPALVFVRG